MTTTPSTATAPINKFVVFITIGITFGLLFLYVACSKLWKEMSGRRGRIGVSQLHGSTTGYGGANQNANGNTNRRSYGGVGRLDGNNNYCDDPNYDHDNDKIQEWSGSNSNSPAGIERGLQIQMEEEKSEMQSRTISTFATAVATATSTATATLTSMTIHTDAIHTDQHPRRRRLSLPLQPKSKSNPTNNHPSPSESVEGCVVVMYI